LSERFAKADYLEDAASLSSSDSQTPSISMALCEGDPMTQKLVSNRHHLPEEQGRCK